MTDTYTLGHAYKGYGSLTMDWCSVRGTSPADPIERAINLAELTPTDKLRMLVCEAGFHELAYLVEPNRVGAPMVGTIVVWSCIQAGWDHPMTLAIFRACEMIYAGSEWWEDTRDAESTAADFFYVLTHKPKVRDELIDSACEAHRVRHGGELVHGGYHGQPVLVGVDC